MDFLKLCLALSLLASLKSLELWRLAPQATDDGLLKSPSPSTDCMVFMIRIVSDLKTLLKLVD